MSRRLLEPDRNEPARLHHDRLRIKRKEILFGMSARSAYLCLRLRLPSRLHLQPVHITATVKSMYHASLEEEEQLQVGIQGGTWS